MRQGAYSVLASRMHYSLRNVNRASAACIRTISFATATIHVLRTHNGEHPCRELQGVYHQSVTPDEEAGRSYHGSEQVSYMYVPLYVYI